ncbi:thymidine phosphorylase [Fusobacterium sp. PH5-44]|uniref:thymidine phosphorylase n=1 Tax=unclassified Fusobacterium TaxID=2648384 RepID=UPI003D198F3D
MELIIVRATDIIEKKRDRKKLSESEIKFFLNSYLIGNIPDYQMSAFLMTIFFNGLDNDELFHFTDTMINSGETIRIDSHKSFLIDKHSTGGVGDKTTIALVGLFGCFGIGEIKLSGRGLGYTGGTVDKFESIPNFKFPQTKDEMIKMVDTIGSGIMSYSDKIVPLDKKIYALRDVTGTVESIPLIASSIMSKKLAIFSDGIILDVKVGSGAFMKNIENARKLSDTMIQLGKKFNRKIISILTDMEQPLGNAVGNSNEIIEAIEMLKGNGPEDFREIVETLIAAGLIMSEKVKTIEEGKNKVREMIKTELPIEHFKKFLKFTGGNPNIVDDYSLLPSFTHKFDLLSTENGYVEKLDAESVGRAAMVLGAGRNTVDDQIDHGVGIVLNKKIGDIVKEGDLLAVIQYNHDKNLNNSISLLEKAYKITKEKVEKRKVILELHL